MSDTAIFSVRCVSFAGLCWLRLDWGTGITSSRVRSIGTRSRCTSVIQSHRDTFNLCRKEDA